MKRIFWITLLAVVVPIGWYLGDLPDTQELVDHNPESSAMRAHREAQFREKGKKPHSAMTWRSLKRISPHLVHAVVISEDDTFYTHNGFDVEQIKRAARTNWERKRLAFGGSTLTQQLARTLYLSSHKNFLRKAKEALITRRLEKTLSKERIIELYLNVVEWGPQVYGAEAAAQHHFGKPASDLTPEEAIALAAILPSPRRWNPRSEKPFMVKRQSILYDRMVRAHYITPVVVSTDTAVEPGEETLEEGEEPAQDTDELSSDDLTESEDVRPSPVE